MVKQHICQVLKALVTHRGVSGKKNMIRSLLWTVWAWLNLFDRQLHNTVKSVFVGPVNIEGSLNAMTSKSLTVAPPVFSLSKVQSTRVFQKPLHG